MNRRESLILAGVLLLGGSLVGCSRDDGSAARTSVGKGPGAVELGELRGQYTTAAKTIDIERLPILGHGTAKQTAAVFTIDAVPGDIEKLPALPIPDGSGLADASMVASERWLAVAAPVCDGPPIEDDVGLVCSEPLGETLLVYGFGSGRWRVLAPTKERPTTTPINLVEDVLEVVVGFDEDGTRLVETVNLAATDLKLEPSDAPRSAVRCSQHRGPDLFFDTTDHPTQAIIPAYGDHPAETFELGAISSMIQPVLPPDLDCISAGRLVLLPARGQAGGPTEPPDVRTGSTTAPVEAVPNRLYDLAHPQAPPIELGDDQVFDLVAGANYFGLMRPGRFEIFSLDGQRRRSVAITGATTVSPFDTTIVLRTEADRRLQAVEIVAVPE